ncbi:MAG: hypothetical protein KGH64_01495, partial [Candidatus Micrarchaeota archaeon]|nr:hypothetical protein [Candidatus Micrarchaeota archaeon]
MPDANQPQTSPAAKPKQVLTSGVKPIWCPGCVLGDTLVVSNPSVKQIQDVKVGDRILTAKGKYKHVADTIVHHHKGLMYKVRAKCFGAISATPEHPFVAVTRLNGRKEHNRSFTEEKIEAKDLKVGDYLVFPVMSEIKDIESMPLVYTKKIKDTRSKELPASLSVNEDLMRLFGYYIAEGSTHNGSVIFSFSTDELEFISDVKKLMANAFGLECAEDTHKENNSIDLVFNSSYLAEILRQLFGDCAQNKQIPHDFMFLPLEKQEGLIRGMWRGDGYFDDSKAGYATISVVLSEQLKMLLLRQNIVPIVYTEPAHGIHRKAYRTYVKDCDDYNRLAGIVGVSLRRTSIRRKRSSVIKEGRVYLPISSIETFDYDGPVYDLTMDDADHTFVTNVTTSGNCGDFGVQAGILKALTELGIEKE